MPINMGNYVTETKNAKKLGYINHSWVGVGDLLVQYENEGHSL